MADFYMEIPENIQAVMDAFHNAGHEAVVVGGAVRDAVMGRVPHDYDIAVSPPPDVSIVVAHDAGFQIIEMGVEHGVIAVVSGGEVVEIASFRGDGNYSDGRRPDSVEYGVSLRQDLARRDFSMNAMAYNPASGELIDPFGGQIDIHSGVINAVGNASNRFQEDALRMMRAVRQGAQFGFEVSFNIGCVISQNAELIRNVSWERIHDEIVKIIESPNPKFMRDIFSVGIAQYIMPEISSEDVDWNAVGMANGNRDVIMAIIFGGHEDVMRRMKFENRDIRAVQNIHDAGAVVIQPIESMIRRHMVAYGVSVFWQAVAMQEARGYAMERVRVMAEEILARGDCVSLGQLAVRGEDIVAVGAEGRQIGEILSQLLDVVCVAPASNERGLLELIARNIVNS